MTAAAVPQTATPVVLIDLSAIFRAVFHVNADQPLSVAFQGTLDGVRRCMNNTPNALVAICCDGKGNWRKELSPSYKAHREVQPAAMYDILDRVKARLKADGLLLWECPGYEADDLLATATDAAVMAGHEVTICSHDKDVLQLLKPEYVRMLKTSTWETVDYEAMVAKFGVTPGQFTDWLALTGDASDGVAGVPGVGPKTAAELLKAHGSIDGIYDAMKDGTIALKGKKLESLNAGIETLELARKLVALKYDAPIRFEEIYEERKQEPLIPEVPPMPEVDAEFVDTIISKPPAKADASPPVPTAPAATATAVANVPATTEAPPSKALALIPQSFELSLEPQSPGQAINLAMRLHNAKLFSWLGNEDQVLAVIMRGREVGLTALVALATFKPVEGQLCASAHFIIDRVEHDVNCEYFYCSETTATSATYKTKHRRNPTEQSLTYTIADAQAAGLVKQKSAWEKYPAAMCRKAAGVFLGRMVYPGSANSFYSYEELGVDEK